MKATRVSIYSGIPHRWNEVNGDAGLGPSAGLGPKAAWGGTVCHPYPFQMPAPLMLQNLVVTKALLFSTD